MVTSLESLKFSRALQAQSLIIQILEKGCVHKQRYCLLSRTKALEMMDQRVKIMNEVIGGMKVIKMYSWELSFTKWIDKIRQ